MEINEAPVTDKDFGAKTRWMAKYVSLFTWFGVTSLLFIETEDVLSDKRVWIMAICAFVFSIAVAPLIWRVADVVRQWIIPDSYISFGAIDSLKQRVFWLIGPQFFAVLLASAIASLASLVIASVVNTKYFSNQNDGSRLEDIQATTSDTDDSTKKGVTSKDSETPVLLEGSQKNVEPSGDQENNKGSSNSEESNRKSGGES